MITLKGQGATAADLPIDYLGARAHFADVPSFLSKIAAMDTLKPLSRPGVYLITHHPMGGLSYQVRMVACMQTSWDETGLRMTPLDFDVEKIQSDLPVAKGFIDGHLRFDARQPAVTNVALDFSVTVEVPIPPVLNLLPRGLVQATGDGIMSLQVGMVVTTLFRKVMDDFKLTVNP